MGGLQGKNDWHMQSMRLLLVPAPQALIPTLSQGAKAYTHLFLLDNFCSPALAFTKVNRPGNRGGWLV